MKLKWGLDVFYTLRRSSSEDMLKSRRFGPKKANNICAASGYTETRISTFRTLLDPELAVFV